MLYAFPDTDLEDASYRQGEIYVHDDQTEQIVCTGPPADAIADLVEELTGSIAAHRHHDPVVQAAMAHEVNPDGALPDRAIDALYTALLGYRIRRSTYVTRSGVDERTASRDLKALTDLGYLRAIGETKGRHYVRGPVLDAVGAALGPRRRLVDPYPWLRARLAQPDSV